MDFIGAKDDGGGVTTGAITRAKPQSSRHQQPEVKFPFPSPFLFPYLFLPLPSPFPSLPSLPLDVGPLNPARGLGSAVSSPAGSGAEPQPKSNLVHYIAFAQRFSIFSLILSFYFGSCGRLSWLNSQLSSAR